jgi:hypothetical protein
MRCAHYFGFATVLASALLLGCGRGDAATDGDHGDHADEHADHGEEHADHDDEHAEHEEEHEGPHGGHVIELGRSHEYHAELVDDEQASTVTVYILDHDLEELPIGATTVSLNLAADGQATPFKLAAVSPADGKASQFTSADPAAFQALHEDEASGKLRVNIAGAPYSGDIEHHHHDE